jgi:hypothetical protein
LVSLKANSDKMYVYVSSAKLRTVSHSYIETVPF